MFIKYLNQCSKARRFHIKSKFQLLLTNVAVSSFYSHMAKFGWEVRPLLDEHREYSRFHYCCCFPLPAQLPTGTWLCNFSKIQSQCNIYMSDSSILSLIGIKKQNYNLPERRETLEAISFMYRTGYFSFVNI